MPYYRFMRECETTTPTALIYTPQMESIWKCHMEKSRPGCTFAPEMHMDMRWLYHLGCIWHLSGRHMGIRYRYHMETRWIPDGNYVHLIHGTHIYWAWLCHLCSIWYLSGRQMGIRDGYHMHTKVNPYAVDGHNTVRISGGLHARHPHAYTDLYRMNKPKLYISRTIFLLIKQMCYIKLVKRTYQ